MHVGVERVSVGLIGPPETGVLRRVETVGGLLPAEARHVRMLETDN